MASGSAVYKKVPPALNLLVLARISTESAWDSTELALTILFWFDLVAGLPPTLLYSLLPCRSGLAISMAS